MTEQNLNTEPSNSTKPVLCDVIKYEKEIDKMLKDLLFENWMDEEDFQEILKLTFEKLGITKRKLSDDIEIGVKNGYSVEYQTELFKRIVSNGA